jgi:hypothetical protein
VRLLISVPAVSQYVHGSLLRSKNGHQVSGLFEAQPPSIGLQQQMCSSRPAMEDGFISTACRMAESMAGKRRFTCMMLPFCS